MVKLHVNGQEQRCSSRGGRRLVWFKLLDRVAPAMPGTMRSTSQLGWLISITAISVLS